MLRVITHSVTGDVLPLDVDADNTTNDNIRISNEMRPGHFAAMCLVGNANDAVNSAFERDRGVCHARRPNKQRRRFLDAGLFKFIAPGF